MKKLILSTLLHYANRDIPYSAKEQFYEIKKEILKKHGRVIGTEYQHIKKECYRCDGTGVFHPNWRPSESCWSCMGSGIYEELVIHLALYQFGKYQFHIPYHRIPIFKKEDLPSVNFIEGYINHKAPRYNIGLEFTLWLLMFYNFKAFRKAMLSSRRLKPVTPLVLIQTSIFYFRCQLPYKTRILLSKLKNRFKNKVDEPVFIDDELPF